MPTITIEEFFNINDRKDNYLKLKRLTSSVGLNNIIDSAYYNRPGMALFGYFIDFAYDKIQVFGRGEANYVITLDKENKTDIFKSILSHKIPICIFTHNIMPPTSFIDIAIENNVCVAVANIKTIEMPDRIKYLLEEQFIESITIHGCLVEVFGVGVLIIGKSGVGKSEATLELIDKGHRLISDDTVEFRKLSDGRIIGNKNEFLKHNMEVRGIGVVDISRLSGMSAIRDRKRLDLVIELEYWNNMEQQYDRMGLDEKFYNILDRDIPYLKIPVRSGRNISILIETAAKNFRLKNMGYHSAKELEKNLILRIEKRKQDVENKKQ